MLWPSHLVEMPTTLAVRARQAFDDLAHVVFPAICNGCGDIAAGGEWAPLLCARCSAEFPVLDGSVGVRRPLAGAHAFAEFNGPARRLLVELKYAGLLRAGTEFGRQMARAPGASKLLRAADLVVPVPLHWRRRWARGHNQAEVIARGLCSAVRRLAVCRALRRRLPTRAQVDLDRQHRAANVHRAFELRRRHRESVVGANVVLVDDVVTTGATAAEAARALWKAGARETWLYTAAWATPRLGGAR